MAEEPLRATVWSAEGARVGIVTCTTCGAALLLDPRVDTDVIAVHADWHLRTVTRI